MTKLLRELVLASSLFIFQSPMAIIEAPQSPSHSAIASIIEKESTVSHYVAVSWATTIEYTSKMFQLNPLTILAVIYVESRFNPKADAGFGTGLMQVVASVHKKQKKILLDPHKNILIGTKILSECKNKTEFEMLRCYNGSARSEYAGKVIKTKLRFAKEFNLHKA